MLTKLVQINEDKKNFFKSNILLKKRVSITKINNENLKSIKDLRIGLTSSSIFCNLLLSIPGTKNCTVVDIKKYRKKIINNQDELLNLKAKFLFLIK